MVLPRSGYLLFRNSRSLKNQPYDVFANLATAYFHRYAQHHLTI